MTKPQRRITISEDCFRALQAEGLVSGESLGDVLDRVVLKGISPKAREILSSIGESSVKVDKQKSNIARLIDNPEALQAIKDMWRSGEQNRAEIARQIGYPKATVAENIKKMLEAGELEEETD